MNQTYARRYQSGSHASIPASLPGGSPTGRIQNARPGRVNGCSPETSRRQPATSMTGTTTRPSSHIGGSSRRSREVTTFPAARLSSEPAVSEPARANMMPIAGSAMDSQGQPKRW
jgi:hypothetical protein